MCVCGTWKGSEPEKDKVANVENTLAGQSAPSHKCLVASYRCRNFLSGSMDSFLQM
jgi:hypothetical protein